MTAVCVRRSGRKASRPTRTLSQWPVAPPTDCEVLPDFRPAQSVEISRSSLLSVEESLRRLTSLVGLQDILFTTLQKILQDLAGNPSQEAAERALDEAAAVTHLFGSSTGRALITGITSATNLQLLRRDEALKTAKSLSREEVAKARSMSFLGSDLFGEDRASLRDYIKARKEEQASQVTLSSLSKSLSTLQSSQQQPQVSSQPAKKKRYKQKSNANTNQTQNNQSRGQDQRDQRGGHHPFRGSNRDRRGGGNQRGGDRTPSHGNERDQPREDGGQQRRRNWHDKRNKRG